VELEFDLVLHVGRIGFGRDGQCGGAEPADRGVLQDIDAAEVRGGILERLGERVAVEHVRGECGGGDALGLQPAGQFVELGAVTGNQRDVEALWAESASDGQAHTGAGSDNGDAGHNNPFDNYFI